MNKNTKNIKMVQIVNQRVLEEVLQAYGGIEKLPNFQKYVEEEGYMIWVTHPKQYGPDFYTNSTLREYDDQYFEEQGGLLLKRYPAFSLNLDDWVLCECADWGEARDYVLKKAGVTDFEFQE